VDDLKQSFQLTLYQRFISSALVA